jgi:hypothetical protein
MLRFDGGHAVVGTRGNKFVSTICDLTGAYIGDIEQNPQLPVTIVPHWIRATDL